MSTRTKPAKTGRMYSGGHPLHLDGPIGAGREGTVHALTDVPELAAKLIGPQNPGPNETARKLAVMTANPPAVTRSRHYRITWPTALITDRKRKGLTLGYLMPRLDGEIYRHIGSYFNPARRRRMLTGRKRGYTYLHLLRLARNLALAVDRIHRHGALVGDLNSRNVLAGDHGRVAIIDTDSFQVSDPDTGEMLRCLVGTPEYTSPKLQGREFSCIDRTQGDDLFALAVMLYQLLMQGSHPFAGTMEPQSRHRGPPCGQPHRQGRLRPPVGPKGTHITHCQRRPHLGGPAPQETVPGRIPKRPAPAPPPAPGPKPSRRPPPAPSGAGPTSSTGTSRRYCTWCRYKTQTGVEPFPSPGQAAPVKPRPRRPAKRRR